MSCGHDDKRPTFITSVLHRVFLQQEVYNVSNTVRQHRVRVRDEHDDDCAVPLPVGEQRDHCTWKAEMSMFVTLAQPPGNNHAHCHNTIAYVHENDCAYVCSEAASLGAECPQDTVLLGQYVIDGNDAMGYEPRIMLFDAIRINGDDLTEMEPPARHAALRNDIGPLLGRAPCAKFVTVQWAGYRDAAIQFCSNGTNLPHGVEFIFRMQQGKPPGDLAVVWKNHSTRPGLHYGSDTAA